MSTDAATVAWNRQRFAVPKTHCYDTAVHGTSLTSIESLPTTVIEIKPSNGRSKQKDNVDRHSKPVGRPFREQQRLSKHLRRRNPTASHSDHLQRYGPACIATGNTVLMSHGNRTLTGRAVIKGRGTRAAIHGTKPQVSAKIGQCELRARNPRWMTLRRAPSQQAHATEASILT